LNFNIPNIFENYYKIIDERMIELINLESDEKGDYMFIFSGYSIESKYFWSSE
jgi:hypothetical protein